MDLILKDYTFSVSNPDIVNLSVSVRDSVSVVVADRGPRGLQGPQGEVGPQGPVGPEGPQGPPGINEWGEIEGTLSDQTDLQQALDDKADDSDLQTHVDDTNNPHEVSLEQARSQGNLLDGAIKFSALETPPTPDTGVWWFNEGRGNFTFYGLNNEIIPINTVFKAKNNEGSTITKFQVVRLCGCIGNNPQVELAVANSNKYDVIGVVLTDFINNNAVGMVQKDDLITGINTSSWTSGTQLWLSTSVPGSVTNVKPEFPNKAIRIGRVVRSHASEGSVFINIDNNSPHSETINHIEDDSIHFTQAEISITESQISDLKDYALDNEVVKLTGNQTINDIKTFNDDTIFNSDVGIGTSNPSERLHVDGNTRFDGQQFSNDRININIQNTAGHIRFQGLNNADWRLGIGTDGNIRLRDHDASGNPTRFLINQDGDVGLGGSAGIDATISDSHLVVRNSGDVGIGTINPQEKLHVSGNVLIERDGTSGNNLVVRSDAFPEATITTTGVTTPAILNLIGRSGTPGATLSKFVLGDYNHPNGLMWKVIRGATNARPRLGLYNTNDEPIIYFRNQEGEVGIGTDDPKGRFTISGGPGVGASDLMLETFGSQHSQWSLRSTSSGDFRIREHLLGEDFFSWTRTGRLGVGTTNPQAKLHVSIDAFDDILRLQNTAGAEPIWNFRIGNGLLINQGSTERLRIRSGRLLLGTSELGSTTTGGIRTSGDSQFGGDVYIEDGELGIGTTNPSEKLHVAGKARIDSDDVDSLTLGTGITDAGISFGTSGYIRRYEWVNTRRQTVFQSSWSANLQDGDGVVFNLRDPENNEVETDFFHVRRNRNSFLITNLNIGSDENPTSTLTVRGDAEVVGSSNGVIIQSPDNTRWRITIDDSGNLNTEEVV